MSNNLIKSVSIIGFGWFGKPLALALKNQYHVVGTTRSQEKQKELTLSGIQSEILTQDILPSSELLASDIIVINVPPFKNQLDWFKSWHWNKNSHVIFISSTSVYGEMEGLLNEEVIPLPSTENARELLAEEAWFKTFPQYTIIRFGGLIGPNRHPGKTLSGRQNISGGNQPVNLIHLDDAIKFTQLVLDNHLTQEIYNLVHPDHPNRRDFYQDYCKKQGLILPLFDDTPSPGKIISHEKVTRVYSFIRNSIT